MSDSDHHSPRHSGADTPTGQSVKDLSDEEVYIRAVLSDIESDVQEDGWALVGSYTDIGTEEDGSFTYTIGLHKRDLPDVITHGLCGCSDAVVHALAERQLKAGAYEDGQITQVGGTMVRLRRWPYTAHLRLLNEYYRHFSKRPTLLLAEPV